jgi:hypothetical protein
MTAPCVLLPFPPAASSRLFSHVALLHLDGRPFARTAFLPGAGPSAAWEWIAETVAAECDCSAEDVHCAETEEGGDLITVDGLPVYMVEISRPAPLLARSVVEKR